MPLDGTLYDGISAALCIRCELLRQAVLPASTVSTVPVMFRPPLAEQEFDSVGDVLDLRQSAQRAAPRDLLALPSVSSCVMSVSMKPGATALTLTPDAADLARQRSGEADHATPWSRHRPTGRCSR